MAKDTIPQDVSESFGSGDEYDAASAFYQKLGDEEDAGEGQPSEDPTKKRPKKEETPSEADEDENDLTEDDETETDPEEGSDDEDEEDGEGESEDDKAKAKVAEDDAEVVLTVDGEERRVSVKDLKRLYGQEASLTRKSQEVAAAKKEADEHRDRHATALSTMLDKAREAYEPYSNIDWELARNELDKDEFSALRKDAKAKFDTYKYLATELDQTMKVQKEQQHKENVERAKKAVEAFKDPESKHHIPNWSPDTWNQIRSFGIDAGLEPELVDALTDPAAIKLIHDAMQFRTAKKVATKKVAKASPKKTHTSKEASGTSSNAAKAARAFKKLQSSGSVEDAERVFLERLGASENE